MLLLLKSLLLLQVSKMDSCSCLHHSIGGRIQTCRNKWNLVKLKHKLNYIQPIPDSLQ